MVRKREFIFEVGIRVFFDDVFFYVFFYFVDVIYVIVEGFFDDFFLKIKDVIFIVDDVKVLKEFEFKGFVFFLMFSLIFVRMVKFVNGRMKVWDFYFDDEMFFDKFRKIMFMCYLSIYGRMFENKEFKIEVFKFKFVWIFVRDIYYRSFFMVFKYFGLFELVWLGYEMGFGEKICYGFGMVKVIDLE